MPGHGGCEPREQPPCQAALSAPEARALEGVSRGVRGRAPRARRAPRPRAGAAGASATRKSAAGESTTGERTGATRGVAHESSGGEDEQLKEEGSARRARSRRARRRRSRERRGDVIASHSRARGRRPEPRKGEEAEGRPLRGEDGGPRSRPGRSRSRRARSRRCFPGRSLGPALARRGGVAWSEEQSDEGASTAAARGARMPRQCQRFQVPQPKAAVVPGATFARAEGVPEDRKAPERARKRRRRGPQGTPQVRARAAWPGVGRPREARSLRPRRLNIVAVDYVEGRAQRDPEGAGVPPRNEVERVINDPGPIAAAIGQRP